MTDATSLSSCMCFLGFWFFPYQMHSGPHARCFPHWASLTCIGPHPCLGEDDLWQNSRLPSRNPSLPSPSYPVSSKHVSGSALFCLITRNPEHIAHRGITKKPKRIPELHSCMITLKKRIVWWFEWDWAPRVHSLEYLVHSWWSRFEEDWAVWPYWRRCVTVSKVWDFKSLMPSQCSCLACCLKIQMWALSHYCCHAFALPLWTPTL